MRVKDPFTEPLSILQQKLSSEWSQQDIFFFLLSNLLELSTHKEEFSSYLLPEFQEKLLKERSRYNFSLNEEDSIRFLTPFHLSFFDLTKNTKKQTGMFFTPSYISKYIAISTLQYYEKAIEGKIQTLLDSSYADIACGTGNLLIPLLNQILIQTKKTDLFSPSSFASFLENNVYGFDLDPLSIWITKLRILFLFSHNFSQSKLPKIETYFQVGNTLLDSQENDFNLEEKLSEPVPLLSTNKDLYFDVIVSNPPYISSGLRNAQKHSPAFRKFLKSRFDSAEYKLTLYPIFIERALELLRKEGILGIITPDSFLLGKYYSKIRSLILKKSKIQEISLLGFEPFHATLGNTVLTFLKKEKIAGTINESNFFSTNFFLNLNDVVTKIEESFQNDQLGFYDNSRQRFFLFFSQEDKNFVENWKKIAKIKLGDIVSFHTGMRSRIGQKKIIATNKKENTWKKGIISGSQIHPFYLKYEGHWLNVDKSKLWSGGFNKTIIEKEKIILRQTGYNIVACVDTEGFYHLNNCHTISPKGGKINLYALATILNSEEFNRVYHIYSLEKGRTLAQVDMDFLAELHIPKLSSFQEEELVNFYHKQKKRMENGETYSAFSLNNIL